MCLTCRTTEKDHTQGSPLSAWMGGATEKDWPKKPSDRWLEEAQKHSDRAITPAVGQSVSLHIWHHQGLCKTSSCTTLTLNSHWGRAATGKKKKVLHLCTQDYFGHVKLFSTLWTVACQTSLSGRGGSPGKNTGAYWPRLANIPFWSTIFPTSPASNPLSTWCCQNPCDPNSCTTSTPDPHRVKSNPSRAASGANPSAGPTYRAGNKTTTETQGQGG